MSKSNKAQYMKSLNIRNHSQNLELFILIQGMRSNVSLIITLMDKDSIQFSLMTTQWSWWNLISVKTKDKKELQTSAVLYRCILQWQHLWGATADSLIPQHSSHTNHYLILSTNVYQRSRSCSTHLKIVLFVFCAEVPLILQLPILRPTRL